MGELLAYCLFSAICGFDSWIGENCTEICSYLVDYVQENVLILYLSRPVALPSASFLNNYSQPPYTRRYTKYIVVRMSLNLYKIS
jgi:hypothetical protein